MNRGRAMKKAMLVSLLSANAVLLAMWATPATAAVEGFRDCCKLSTGGLGYCCEGCCWIVHNCHSTTDCADE